MERVDEPQPDSRMAWATVIDGKTPYSFQPSIAPSATLSMKACWEALLEKVNVDRSTDEELALALVATATTARTTVVELADVALVAALAEATLLLASAALAEELASSLDVAALAELSALVDDTEVALVALVALVTLVAAVATELELAEVAGLEELEELAVLELELVALVLSEIKVTVALAASLATVEPLRLTVEAAEEDVVSVVWSFWEVALDVVSA